MPSVSRSQQKLFQAAEHGADFPMAKKLRKSMTHDQLHDFSVGSETGKPQHVLKGGSKGIIHENKNTYQRNGLSEADATKRAIQASKKSHPNRHKNLKGFLHARKDGKPYGS